MTTMIAELYDALIAAGSPQDEARAAAAAMAEHDPGQQRFIRIEANIGELKNDVSMLKADIVGLKTDISELKRDVAALKSDNLLMKWMLGFVLAFQIAIFIKLFLH